MTAVPFARKSAAPDTTYMTFRQTFGQREYTVDGVDDKDNGKSPVSRWLTYAIDYSDFVSSATGTPVEATCIIPRGTLILECLVRLDTAFAGGTSNAVDVGDANDADGWAVNLDLTTATTTTPIWFRDADAAYNNKATDITQGTAGAQFYENGGVVRVTMASFPTAGEMLLFLHTISYHEDQSKEW